MGNIGRVSFLEETNINSEKPFYFCYEASIGDENDDVILWFENDIIIRLQNMLSVVAAFAQNSCYTAAFRQFDL